jgi:hypothetical protein
MIEPMHEPSEKLSKPFHLFSDEDSGEWEEWYRLTPQERWTESMKLWEFYLSVGGSLEAEPDSQSPFDAFMPRGEAPAYRRASVRVLRRGRV